LRNKLSRSLSGVESDFVGFGSAQPTAPLSQRLNFPVLPPISAIKNHEIESEKIKDYSVLFIQEERIDAHNSGELKDSICI